MSRAGSAAHSHIFYIVCSVKRIAICFPAAAGICFRNSIHITRVAPACTRYRAADAPLRGYTLPHDRVSLRRIRGPWPDRPAARPRPGRTPIALIDGDQLHARHLIIYRQTASRFVRVKIPMDWKPRSAYVLISSRILSRIARSVANPNTTGFSPCLSTVSSDASRCSIALENRLISTVDR